MEVAGYLAIDNSHSAIFEARPLQYKRVRSLLFPHCPAMSSLRVELNKEIFCARVQRIYNGWLVSTWYLLVLSLFRKFDDSNCAYRMLMKTMNMLP